MGFESSNPIWDSDFLSTISMQSSMEWTIHIWDFVIRDTEKFLLSVLFDWCPYQAG